MNDFLIEIDKLNRALAESGSNVFYLPEEEYYSCNIQLLATWGGFKHWNVQMSLLRGSHEEIIDACKADIINRAGSVFDGKEMVDNPTKQQLKRILTLDVVGNIIRRLGISLYSSFDSLKSHDQSLIEKFMILSQYKKRGAGSQSKIESYFDSLSQ